MVSQAVIRKATEIVNRGHVMDLGNETFIVTRKDTGSTALVFTYRDGSGRTRWVSDDKHFRSTGRESTYITAAKIFAGVV